MQAGAVLAIADEDEGARPRIQHVGEILRPHHRRQRVVDAILAGDLGRDLRRERRLLGMVAR